MVKNFYAQNIGKLVRSCGTGTTHNRKVEVDNVMVNQVKECIVGLNVNEPADNALLTNIQVQNATKNAGICKTYQQRMKEGPLYLGKEQKPGICTWGADVTIS